MSNFFTSLNLLVNRFLVLLGLRRQNLHWGIVYDSVSKQPLDPVIVQLVDAHTGQVVQACVSDLAGRFNFLAYPGKFKILVKKSNYTFPSAVVPGERDGIYRNLYHGEFFTLTQNSDVIPFNIPMDPAQKDWNQKAKAKIVHFDPFAEKFLFRLTVVLFWFVLLLSLLSLLRYNSAMIYAVLGFYAVVFLLWLALPEPRWWGRVRFKEGGRPAGGLAVELSYPAMPSVVVAKAVTAGDGKFLLRVDPGRYLVCIAAASAGRRSFPYQMVPVESSGAAGGSPGQLYRGMIRVGEDQVVNRTFSV